MSLEKEAFEYAIDKKQIPTDFKKGTFYFDKEGLISFLSDFATQQTEKLNTELEQTKEKLKRCEEVIGVIKTIINSNEAEYVKNARIEALIVGKEG